MMRYGQQNGVQSKLNCYIKSKKELEKHAENALLHKFSFINL